MTKNSFKKKQMVYHSLKNWYNMLKEKTTRKSIMQYVETILNNVRPTALRSKNIYTTVVE